MPPLFLQLATHGTHLIELIVFPLIFLPFRNSRIRCALFIMLFAFHLGTLLLMSLEMFSFVMISYIFVLLPRSDLIAMRNRFPILRYVVD